jgi:hypothetical protein
MSWTSGPRLYEKFEVRAAGLAQTIATSDETIQAFKSQFLEDEDYDNQLDFIRELKNPCNMKPGTFLFYLRIQNSMVQELPGALDVEPGFVDQQLRIIYLHAMPVQGQSKFEDADKTVVDMSLNAMCAYFDKQHAKDPYKNQTESQNNNKKKQEIKTQKVITTATPAAEAKEEDDCGRGRRRDQGQGHSD